MGLFGFGKKKKHNTVEFTDQNWNDEIINYDGPVMVDIWAPWCGPCKLIGPIVDELAIEYDGKVKIGKLNSDANSKSRELGVRSIPTMLFFKNGKKVGQIVGAQPMNIIREQLDKISN
jgi:thioredoxin 1